MKRVSSGSAPGRFSGVLAWLVAASLAWLGVASCVGDPVDPELGEAERLALQRFVSTAPPSLMIAHDAAFGGTSTTPKLSLVGYLLKPRKLTQTAGTTFQLTLVWQAHESLPTGFRVFTHLVDERGRILGNFDSAGPLRAVPGRPGCPWPPSRWEAGRYVLDPIDVALPADAPLRVRLDVGLYRGSERLEAFGGGVDADRATAVIWLNTMGSSVDEVPTLAVPQVRRGTAIAIDGVLDEAVWKKAARTGAFVNVGSGEVSSTEAVQGSARLMYDDAYLFVAFEVADRDVRGGFEIGSRDPHLWTRDTVEIMIDPDGDGDNADYYEIQIGPQNLVFDSLFDGYNTPRGGPDGPYGHEAWTCNALSAVTVVGTLDDPSDVDGGYVVEARIPFTAFERAERSPPDAGDRWRANFYAMQNNGGVAWSPILGQGNFHKASRFGRILWSDAEIP